MQSGVGSSSGQQRGGLGSNTAKFVVKGRYSTYLLQDVLGKGGSAIVYRAEDKGTGQAVAVKKITAQDEAAMHQWRTEVETLMALREDDDGSHHVIRYLDHMQAAKTIIIVEEFAMGGSLLSRLRAQGQGFREKTTALLVHQVTSGLAYIHAKGIVHRDLKCANVLVCDRGQVKLSDFGLSAANPANIAAAVAAATTTTTAGGREGEEGEEVGGDHPLLGSVYWMAPETVRGKKNNLSSDIWSLGCLCIELLTGKPPFFERPPANALYHIADSTEPVPMPSVPLSEDGKRFIRACLSRNSADRPTATQLLEWPWLADARVRLRLDAIVARAGENVGLAVGSDDVGQWVESNLFADEEEQGDEWVREGNLRKVVAALPFLTATEAHGAIRSFAFAAKEWSAARFVNPLGEADLWSYGGLDLTDKMPSHAARIFVACCRRQDAEVHSFAPASPRAITFFLSSPQAEVAAAAVDAMAQLYCSPGGDASVTVVEGGEAEVADATARKRRRITALRRLVADGGLLAIRTYLERVCENAFHRDETPSVGWGGVDQLFHILRATQGVEGAEAFLWCDVGNGSATAEAEAEAEASDEVAAGAAQGGNTNSPALVELLGASRTPTVRWYLAVQEASRRACGGAAAVLVTLVERLAQRRQTQQETQQQQKLLQQQKDEKASPSSPPQQQQQHQQQRQRGGKQAERPGIGNGRTAADGTSKTTTAAADATAAAAATASAAASGTTTSAADAGPDAGEEVDYLEAAGMGLAGTLVSLVCCERIPAETRLHVVQCLPVLSQNAPRAAHFFADEHTAVPLLAYLLCRVPAPERGGRQETVQTLLSLCGDPHIRASCAASPLFRHALARLLCAAVAEEVQRNSDVVPPTEDVALLLGLVDLLRGSSAAAREAVTRAVAEELHDAPEAVRGLGDRAAKKGDGDRRQQSELCIALLQAVASGSHEPAALVAPLSSSSSAVQAPGAGAPEGPGVVPGVPKAVDVTGEA